MTRCTSLSVDKPLLSIAIAIRRLIDEPALDEAADGGTAIRADADRMNRRRVQVETDSDLSRAGCSLFLVICISPDFSSLCKARSPATRAVLLFLLNCPLHTEKLPLSLRRILGRLHHTRLAKQEGKLHVPEYFHV